MSNGSPTVFVRYIDSLYGTQVSNAYFDLMKVANDTLCILSKCSILLECSKGNEGDKVKVHQVQINSSGLLGDNIPIS